MTEQQQKFIDALFGEARGNATKAKKIAGYGDGTPASSVLSSEKVKKAVEDRTRDLITSFGPESVFTLGDILSGKELLGAKEKMAAAKDLLDRAGFSKTEKVEVTARDPLFILPAKKEEDVD